jgi:hypothetical protein
VRSDVVEVAGVRASAAAVAVAAVETAAAAAAAIGLVDRRRGLAGEVGGSVVLGSWCVCACVCAYACGDDGEREEVDDETEDGRAKNTGLGHWGSFDGKGRTSND